MPPLPAAAAGDTWLSSPLLLVTVLALMGLLPILFMTATAFVKISTVLQLVRGAIGAQNVPSQPVLLTLGAALACVAMIPVGVHMMGNVAPLLVDSSTPPPVLPLVQALEEPLRRFLEANAHPAEVERFFELAKHGAANSGLELARNSWVVLAPAFLVTELSEAFALGFAIYLPFLVLDLIVANVLLALGMQTMNPQQVSLPFKLLLFVAVDGWGLLAQTLIADYRF